MASRVRNITCPACAKNFTQTGFQSHLRQTKDQHCAALFAEIANTGMDLDDHEHQPLDNDVFGGHDNYEFGQLQDKDDEQLEDSEEEQANLENGWEPERPSHIVVRYTDKYPDHQAGAPMKKTQPGDDNYRAALDNSSNPWATFSSQMDWEIAKWAKLRGAGSTAFSDLLAIEGVSKYCGSACRVIFHTNVSKIFKGSRSAQIII